MRSSFIALLGWLAPRAGFALRTPNAWFQWADACQHVHHLPNVSDHAPRLIARIASGDAAAAKQALQDGATRLRHDLASRNVLCDPHHPCHVSAEVHAANSMLIRACVPPGAPALGARLCDPWGLDFQQEGGVLEQTQRPTTRPPRANTLGGSSQAERLASGLTNGAACVVVNVTQLAHWWARHRTRRPFLHPAHPHLSLHLEAKEHSGSGSRPSKPTGSQRRLLDRLLNASNTRAFAPQSLGKCAFVGSGHDLRCHEPPVGAEIDTTYDAVFRANAAQQHDHPHQHCVDPALAGRRTDFRTVRACPVPENSSYLPRPTCHEPASGWLETLPASLS